MESKDAAYKDADSILCCISAVPPVKMKLSWLHLRLSFAYAEGGEDNISAEK